MRVSYQAVPEAPTPEQRPSKRRHRRDQRIRSTPQRSSRSDSDRLIALETRAIRRLLSWIGNPPLAVVLYGGKEICAAGVTAVARVLIRDRRTLWKLAIDPLYEFGEAYAAGRIEVEGDLTELLSIAMRSIENRSTKHFVTDRLVRLLHRPRVNTLSKSRQHIAHHYDIGNDFYQLWLDDQLVYTCAYFPQPTLTLEQAQFAKMDHVCRKLRLRPGQTVLEAGCGWGALALHMAQHYGVKVKAFNISHEQIAYARQRARQSDLHDRVEFVEDDWRNMQQPCDAFVSVGMLEHVGVENYARLGDVIQRNLKPNGYGLIHTIGQNHPQLLNPWIEGRIFPGAYPPTLRQMMNVFQPYDFSVIDVENLRMHYALTIRHWLERFEQAVDSVRQMFDERFVRMWRFYLSGSIAAFETGSLQLFQVVFTNGADSQVPWTRADLYSQREDVRA